MSEGKIPEIAEQEPLNKCVINEVLENKSFKEKLSFLKSHVTVEPVLAGFVVSSTLSRLAIQNLNLEKTCRIKLDYGDNICNSLMSGQHNSTEYEGEVQRVISSIETWKSVIETAIPIVLIVLMGAWTDRTGNRKICILLPILGELMVCLSNLTSTYFFNEISVEVTMFCEGIFPALTGGWVMMFLGVFSYISDITDNKSRTFRVGLVNLCMTAGIPLGTALSGILLKQLGYYGIFTISGSIYLLTFLYGLCFLKSKTKPDKPNEKQNPLTCLEVFNMVNDTAAVAFKKRSGNTRKKIIWTLLVVAILYGPSHGERKIFYMFLRYRLNWDALKYSFYTTYSIITHSIGALFSISVFSKRLGYHDSVLCLISVFSKLASSVFILFVTSNTQMFMVPLVEILNATTWTSLRSMASKLVSSEEMGKMNSLFSLVETLAALMFDPTYAAMYRGSIGVFIGAVFVFSACITLPAISILLWFFVQHRKETKQKCSAVDSEKCIA